MKLLTACSISKDSGSYLVGKYLTDSIRKTGIEVDYLSTFNSKPLKLYYLISIPHNLFRIIFKKCDIAMALKPYPNTTYPLILKKIMGSKIVLFIDDLDINTKKGIINKILSFTLNLPLKYFDLILVHNTNLYKLVLELGIPQEKILQIEQGVDLNIFKEKTNKTQIRKKLGFNEEEKLIIYTGHLNVAAHLEEIIEAFKIFSKNNTKTKLIIAGGGPDEKKFKNLVNKEGLNLKVQFTGYIKNQNLIADYLNIANACVVYYPAKEFNKYRSSMKIREYLSVGTPTVCNDFGDLARFKDYTYSFKTEDKIAFSNMLKKAIYSNDGREKKGQEFVQKNMSWEKIGISISEAIKKC